MPYNLKDVFVINEKQGEEKPAWTRIGVAFVNRDESINVVLDAVPMNGKLHIRDRKASTKQQKGERP